MRDVASAIATWRRPGCVSLRVNADGIAAARPIPIVRRCAHGTLSESWGPPGKRVHALSARPCRTEACGIRELREMPAIAALLGLQVPGGGRHLYLLSVPYNERIHAPIRPIANAMRWTAKSF